MQGSGRKPYVLKNTGGVYSCSCPAWRNQSLPIEKRTCKHLRKLRGEEAETERIGTVLPKAKKEKKTGPPILLAHSWDGEQDLTYWWLSEKLDGVRAYWDGEKFLSRQGNEYLAPEWFTHSLPNTPLDGELWIDRGEFQRTVSIVRRQDRNDLWQEVRFVVFDAPEREGTFEERQAYLKVYVFEKDLPFAKLLPQYLCVENEDLLTYLQEVENLGGEGVMAREPKSLYTHGRSTTLLKVKTFHDDEAFVLEHLPGKGRHKGRMGALFVQLQNGTKFSVGSGFKDLEREDPPAVGSVITFRYQELTDGGVPRFPTFLRVREDSGLTAEAEEAVQSYQEVPQNPVQRFEYEDEKSHKFWEISQTGLEVTTRYGRIGSKGQEKIKSFPTEEKAENFVASSIIKKEKKGYLET